MVTQSIYFHSKWDELIYRGTVIKFDFILVNDQLKQLFICNKEIII